jgi:hypothetical protein
MVDGIKIACRVCLQAVIYLATRIRCVAVRLHLGQVNRIAGLLSTTIRRVLPVQRILQLGQFDVMVKGRSTVVVPCSVEGLFGHLLCDIRSSLDRVADRVERSLLLVGSSLRQPRDNL